MTFTKDEINTLKTFYKNKKENFEKEQNITLDSDLKII